MRGWPSSATMWRYARDEKHASKTGQRVRPDIQIALPAIFIMAQLAICGGILTAQSDAWKKYRAHFVEVRSLSAITSLSVIRAKT